MVAERKQDVERVGLHVRLPVDLLRKLRIRAAEMDINIQDFVEAALAAAVRKQLGAAAGKQGARR